MKKIFVVGSLNVDMVISAKRIPLEGETITGEDFFINLGGKGANQAAICGNLNADVFMIGAVGNDVYGSQHKTELEKRGVDVDAIQVIKGYSTGTAVITKIAKNNRIIIYGGANEKICFKKAEEFLKQKASEGDFLLLQQEIGKHAVEHAVKLGQKFKMRIVLNPAPAFLIKKDLYKFVDTIIPNETEAQILTGENCETHESIKKALKKLVALGVKNAIITLGKNGCAFCEKGGEAIFAAARKINVVDTTGAGDTFVGSMCTALCNGSSLENAIKFATAASAATCLKKGAYLNFPKRNEIDF